MLSPVVSLCPPLSSKVHRKGDRLKESVCVLEDFLLFLLILFLCSLLCFDFFGLDLSSLDFFVLVFVAKQIDTGCDNSVTGTPMIASEFEH